MLTVYNDMPQYAIKPRSLESFYSLCYQMVATVDDGVPANTAANEYSAYNRYWIPFCHEMGTNPVRPDYAELNAAQKAAEDKLKAIALPWIHARMKGRKRDVADPNSAMNSLRSINRVLNRHADEETSLKRAMKVLKGMLRKHVAIFGPLQPDPALPFTTGILKQLLSFPSHTKFGRFTLDWGTNLGLSLRAMFEVAAQTGLRLDECTINREDFNFSKMTKASVVYRIGGNFVKDPDPVQLRSMTSADGACLSPACSKCDPTGAIHGGKIMFLPFRPDHAWNGCRALVNLELQYPTRGADRHFTPLFNADGDEPIKASFVRTLLHHMLEHPHMQQVLPPTRTTKYSFHSFRKFYATCLAQAGATRERIQSLCRWASPDSVESYDILGFTDHTQLIDAAYLSSPDAITPAILSTLADTPIDDNEVMLEWCHECHVDLTACDKLDWKC